MPGDGPVPCDVMLVAEAPGQWEDRTGIPMSSPTGAGAVLEDLLERNGLPRRRVYVTNLVKCRPPRNRDPERVEIDTCTAHYLKFEIERVKPKVIIACGRFAVEYFLPGEKLSKVHGTPRRRGGIVVLPVYHPAAALHNPKMRAALERDYTAIPDALALALEGEHTVTVLDGVAPPAPLIALDTEARIRDSQLVCFSTSVDGVTAWVGIPTQLSGRRPQRSAISR